MTRFRASAVFCLFVMIPLSMAQTTPASPSPSPHPVSQNETEKQAAPTSPAGPVLLLPSDLSLLKVVAQNQHVTTTLESELDRRITVAVQGLQNWMKSTGKHPRDLRLYLAGQKLSESGPTLASAQGEYLYFHLEIHPKDRDAWVQILYDARQAENHKIPLSIGSKDTMQVVDSSVDIALMVYPHYTAYIVGLLLLLLAAMLILSFRTDLLRDGTNPPPRPARLPYNLGKVQMAFWFYLAITAYLYVWLVTGEYNSLTNSVLALIGISAGTGLAAVFLDKQKAEEVLRQQSRLETQETALTARINDLTTAPPAPGSQLDQELQQKKNSLIEVQAQLAHAAPPLPASVSSGFLHDILSSGEGVGFHRFQMMAWTLILGIIFVSSVYRDLTMPDFDTSLLGLMGLSSGTYIGFTFPEKPK
jgi:hypothetical protein